jgi:uncharacterized protein involved in exopolysaccharide biosynthesis
MDGSLIKSTFRDYVRVIFHRKKFILLPVIGIPLCLAIYAFIIAPVIYKAENRVVVLDNKTNRPILGNLSMTSDLGKRIDTSVKRITSRSGITAIVASIDYLSDKFPASSIVQYKRRDVLAQKRGILDYRLNHINSRIVDMNSEMIKAGEAAEKRSLSFVLEDLLRDKRLCESQIEELQKKIHDTDNRISEIQAGDAELQGLVERSKKEPQNENIRLLIKSRRQGQDEEQARLEKTIDSLLTGLKVGINGNSITVSFESEDPQLSKDVVDETLVRLEFENLSIKKQEIVGTAQILDQKIEEYQQKVADEEGKLKDFQRLYVLEASPGELSTQEFYERLVREGTIVPTDMPVPYILTQYRTLQEKCNEIDSNITARQAEIKTLGEQLKTTPEYVEGSVTESTPEHVKRLMEELQNKIIERNKMLETKTDKHPHVQQITAAIERLKGIIDSEDKLVVTQTEHIKNPIHTDLLDRLSKAQTQSQVLQADGAARAKELGYYRERAQQLPEILQRHTRLAAQLVKDNNTLRDLLQRKSSAEITQALEVDSDEGMRFEKPDPTAMPAAPYKPNRRLLLLLGLLLGAAAAAVLLFFVEYADRSIRGAADVKRHLGLPVLGTVPQFFKTAKGIKVNTGLSARKALTCATVTAVVSLLVISFIFERETSDLINQQMHWRGPVAEKNHLAFPVAFLDWSGETATARTPANSQTKSFAPQAPAPEPAIPRTVAPQAPAAPEMEVLDPGVIPSEEKP